MTGPAALLVSEFVELQIWFTQTKWLGCMSISFPHALEQLEPELPPLHELVRSNVWKI